MSPRPTATVDRSTSSPRVVFTRTFSAPIEEVWAAVSDPDRMSRWVGTWTGDPSSGRVTFRMDEAGAEDEETVIRVCDPPRRWAVTTATGGESWYVAISLTERADSTHLEFAQELTDPDTLPSIGPDWEYYLDRLDAHLRGEQVDQVRFEDYYPSMSAYFAGLV